MSDYFPQELLLQILKRLPPKSLLRFRCVSKSWCSLISSPSFITMHTTQLNSSPTDPTATRTLVRHYCRLRRRELYTVHFDTDTDTKSNSSSNSFALDRSIRIQFPFESFSRFYFRIVGYCNGLICLSDDLFGYNHTITLWNPAIRRNLTLPVPRAGIEDAGSYMSALGFGFDHKRNDYKVVRITYIPDLDNGYIVPPEVEVYTVKEGAWRGVNDASPRYCVAEFFWSQVFINGSVHWIAYHRIGGRGGMLECLIMVFGMSDEVFHEMALPESLLREVPMNLFTAVNGESLAVFQFDKTAWGSSCSIWVMKEYGVVESWSKLFSTGVEGGLGVILGLRKNNEVLSVGRNGELVSYNPESRQSTDLGIIGTKYSCWVNPYRESLALLLEGRRVWERQESNDSLDLYKENDKHEVDEEEGDDQGDAVEANEILVQSAIVQFLNALLNEQ